MAFLFCALIVFTHILLPIWLIYWLAFTKGDNLLYRSLIGLLVFGYLVTMALAGAGWYWVGSFWPLLFLLLFVPALARLILKSKGLAFWPERRLGPLLKIVITFTLAFSFLFSLKDLRAGRKLPEGFPILELSSPLRGGTFSVVHGGNSPALNHHHPVAAQRFSVDLVKIHPLGWRASGLLPKDLSRYFIFGEPVYAPCSGEVLGVANHFEDHGALQMDLENPAGNYVLIDCGDASVMLAHLQEGSVIPAAGDLLEEGQLLGSVGNSGNSSEPHLHLQAIRGRAESVDDFISRGQPLPFTIGGQFLSRGQRLKEQQVSHINEGR